MIDFESDLVLNWVTNELDHSKSCEYHMTLASYAVYLLTLVYEAQEIYTLL